MFKELLYRRRDLREFEDGLEAFRVNYLAREIRSSEKILKEKKKIIAHSSSKKNDPNKRPRLQSEFV